MSRRLLDKTPEKLQASEFSAVQEKGGVKLNVFQRGILQKCATVFAYLFSIGLGAFILDWIDKRLFIRLAEEAQQKEILSQKAAQGFIALIEARDSTAIFAIIFGWPGLRAYRLAFHALGGKTQLVVAGHATKGG